MSWFGNPNRVFREYVARTMPQALAPVAPQAPPVRAPIPMVAPTDPAAIAALLRLTQQTRRPAPSAQTTPTPEQAAAVQAYLQQQTQGGPMPPGTTMPPLPAMQNLGARRGVGFTGGEDAAGLHLPPEERTRLAEMAVADYGRQAAERRTQEAGEAHADPVAGFIIEEALPRLDVPRQENIEHVIGPIIRQVVTGDVPDFAAGVAGGLPVVGPILGGLDFLQETLNDTQFAEGMRQAATQGYNGFTGDRAVWEYLIGQTDDWHPVPRFIVRALADTAVDPLTLLPLIGKIGTALRGAATAGKVARGATAASMGERAMDITGRILQAPTVLLDEPIDALFGTAGAVLRGAGGKVGGLFDLRPKQQVEDIKETLTGVATDVQAGRAQPAPTGQVTETDYFGPGGSMAEPAPLALPQPPMIAGAGGIYDPTQPFQPYPGQGPPLALPEGPLPGTPANPRPMPAPPAPPPVSYPDLAVTPYAGQAPPLALPPGPDTIPVGDRRMFQGRIIRTVGTDGTVRVKETADGRWVVQEKEGRVWVDKQGAATEDRAIKAARRRISSQISQPIPQPAPRETVGQQPIPEPMVRLYRAQARPDADKPVPAWIRQGQQESGQADAMGRWFTDDPEAVRWYLEDAGEGARLFSVDVPASQVDQYRVRNIPQALRYSRDPDVEFFVPRKIANQKREMGIGDLPPSKAQEPVVTPPPTVAQEPIVTPPPAPEPAQPAGWKERMRTMTAEERNAHIADPRSPIGVWTPWGGGNRMIDRAYFRYGDQYPAKEAAFEADVKDQTRAFVQTQRQHERTYYDTLQQKQAMGAINGVEHTVDVIAPAYRRHFGDVDPTGEIPTSARAQAPTTSGKASYRQENGAYLVEQAVYGTDEKAASVLSYLDRTLPQGATDRIRAARAKAQAFRGAPPHPKGRSTEIPGGTYYHVAGPGYQRGDDILAWQEYEGRYGEPPGPWKYEGDPFDTDIVSLFPSRQEAEEFATDYGGTVLRVDIPDRPRELNLITGYNDEGYPFVMGRVPAEYVAPESPPRPERSAAAADFALTPESAAAQTQAALREVGQAIGGAANRVIPDLVGAPEQGVIPRALGEGITAGQIEVDGRLIPVSAEVQILHDSGTVTFEGAQLLSTRVTMDPALFRKRGEEPALAKTRKQATPAGTITVENPTEMTVLDFMDLLHGAGFADERMLTLTAEAVARARGILKDGKPDGDFLRATKKVLRPIGKGYDAIIRELRNHIQFNIANAPRGVLLDTVSDGYKMGLTGHWRAMGRQLNIGGRASRTAYRGIRQNTQDGMDALFPVEAELGISRKLRVPGSRSEVDVTGRTFIEKIEAAISAPKIASRIFSSSEYRDFRHARDELRRMLVYSDVVERALPAALERFVGVIRRQAATTGVEPQTWIDGIREAASAAGKTTGVFDANDVLRGTGNTDLSRAWKRELNALRTAGHEAQEDLFFSYKQLSADAILRRTMFFHYWMSRELLLHARLTLKNPALMASYYRFWEGWQRVAEEEAYPTSVRAFMGFMVDTTGGWASVFDPASMLVPWTMFSEMTNEDMPTFDRLGVFFNPIVQGAAAAWGMTERTPDLTGTYGVRSLIRAVADYGQGQGIDVLGRFGGGDGALDQWQRRVLEKVNELATGFDFPGAEEYEPFRPETNQIDTLRSVVMAKAQEQGLSIDSPQVQDAFAAIDAGDYESNPLSEAAFKEYTAHRLFGKLVGVFFPNRQRFGPRDEAIAGNRQFGEAIGAGQTPTPEAEAAHLERESATSAEPELVSQADQYFNLGTERQRSLHSGWSDIAYGDEWAGSYMFLGGRVIQGTDLMAMEDDQRRAVADAWVAQHDGAQELDAYRTMRDDFISRNPAFAEYDEYRDLAFGYEGGVRAFRTDMSQHHPEFADELEERRAFFRGDGRRGEVLEKELDQWATSQAGYHAFRGERDSIYDEQPEPAYDVSRDPYLSARGAGDSGGGTRTAKSTAERLAEDLAAYEVRASHMAAVLGVPIEQMNPIALQLLGQQYGDQMPETTRLMDLYQQWMMFQPPGADTSPQAFGAYMDELERQELLGLMPAA